MICALLCGPFCVLWTYNILLSSGAWAIGNISDLFLSLLLGEGGYGCISIMQPDKAGAFEGVRRFMGSWFHVPVRVKVCVVSNGLAVPFYKALAPDSQFLSRIVVVVHDSIQPVLNYQCSRPRACIGTRRARFLCGCVGPRTASVDRAREDRFRFQFACVLLSSTE